MYAALIACRWQVKITAPWACDARRMGGKAEMGDRRMKGCEVELRLGGDRRLIDGLEERGREGAKDGGRGSPQAGRDGRFGDGRHVRGKRRRSSGRPRSGIRVLAGLFAGLVWSEIRTRAADDTRVGYSSGSRGLDRVYKDYRRLRSSFSPFSSTNEQRLRQTSPNRLHAGA